MGVYSGCTSFAIARFARQEDQVNWVKDLIYNAADMTAAAVRNVAALLRERS